LRPLLFTGSRAGEALRAEWSEFDLARGVWTKPSHHTKQKKTDHLKLSEAAIELLRSMKPRNAIGPLFPGKEGGARVSLKRPWLQARKAAGLAQAYTVVGKRKRLLVRYRPTVRLHDLRHSYASHLVSSGEGLQVVGKLPGHVQASTTMKYAHVHDQAARVATNRFVQIIGFPSKKTA
jgi:integrase